MGIRSGCDGVTELMSLESERGTMSQDAWECFQVWLSLPDRNLREAAEIAGFSHDSARQWSSRHKWGEIAARWDATTAAQLLGALRGAIVRHSFRAVQIGVDAMEDTEAKWGDRLKAAAWIASLGGLGPRSAPAVPDVDNGVGAINADDLRKLATSGDPDDLRKLVRLTTGGRD